MSEKNAGQNALSRLAVNGAAYRIGEAAHKMMQATQVGDWRIVEIALNSIRADLRVTECEYDAHTCARCGKLPNHKAHERALSDYHEFLAKDA